MLRAECAAFSPSACAIGRSVSREADSGLASRVRLSPGAFDTPSTDSRHDSGVTGPKQPPGFSPHDSGCTPGPPGHRCADAAERCIHPGANAASSPRDAGGSAIMQPVRAPDPASASLRSSAADTCTAVARACILQRAPARCSQPDAALQGARAPCGAPIPLTRAPPRRSRRCMQPFGLPLRRARNPMHRAAPRIPPPPTPSPASEPLHRAHHQMHRAAIHCARLGRRAPETTKRSRETHPHRVSRQTYPPLYPATQLRSYSATQLPSHPAT